MAKYMSQIIQAVLLAANGFVEIDQDKDREKKAVKEKEADETISGLNGTFINHNGKSMYKDAVNADRQIDPDFINRTLVITSNSQVLQDKIMNDIAKNCTSIILEVHDSDGGKGKAIIVVHPDDKQRAMHIVEEINEAKNLTYQETQEFFQNVSKSGAKIIGFDGLDKEVIDYLNEENAFRNLAPHTVMIGENSKYNLLFTDQVTDQQKNALMHDIQNAYIYLSGQMRDISKMENERKEKEYVRAMSEIQNAARKVCVIDPEVPDHYLVTDETSVHVYSVRGDGRAVEDEKISRNDPQMQNKLYNILKRYNGYELLEGTITQDKIDEKRKDLIENPDITKNEREIQTDRLSMMKKGLSPVIVLMEEEKALKEAGIAVEGQERLENAQRIAMDYQRHAAMLGDSELQQDAAEMLDGAQDGLSEATALGKQTAQISKDQNSPVIKSAEMLYYRFFDTDLATESEWRFTQKDKDRIISEIVDQCSPEALEAYYEASEGDRNAIARELRMSERETGSISLDEHEYDPEEIAAYLQDREKDEIHMDLGDKDYEEEKD